MSENGESGESGEIVDVGALLSIDVESELRKLTEAQLQGAWQLPAELVRRALRHGARRVDVEMTRHHMRVRDDGRPVLERSMKMLRDLLDAEGDMDDRHRALSGLEASGDLALLALAGLRPTEMQIVVPHAKEHQALVWQRGRASLGRRTAKARRSSFNEIEVRGARLDRARAREWLQQMARFADADIRVDGVRLGRGFGESIAVFSLGEVMGVRGRVAIPHEGDTTRLWLMRDGVVSTHITVADAPCFEAAIEMSTLLPAEASPPTGERIRELATGIVEPIVDRVIEELVEMGRRGASLPAAERTRVTQLLLRAARDRRHGPTIAQIPLFRGLEPDGRERYFDLLALRQSVSDDGDERHVVAVLPEHDLSDFTPAGRVFVLDEIERGLLREIFDLRFRSPPRRAGKEGGLLGMRRAAKESLRLRAADFVDALRQLSTPGGTPLHDDDLSPSEAVLVSSLRAQLDDREIGVCLGAGAIRRGPRRLVLPRDNPQVRACVRLVAEDPAWVYPAILSLLEGREFPDRARRRWGIDAWIERD